MIHAADLKSWDQQDESFDDVPNESKTVFHQFLETVQGSSVQKFPGQGRTLVAESAESNTLTPTSENLNEDELIREAEALLEETKLTK